jgi:2-dehydro-3-deoxyphosphogluconate aldolase / (4S)-4-hydroxy-2-oxoglutarate aldolase
LTSDWLDALSRLRLIPVVVIERAQDAWSLAQALKAGGLACAEVTLRTAAATAAIREMARDADILLGAGTVLVPSQVDDAVDAGASFIVTPGVSPAVVHRCAERGVPVLPGVATPTERFAGQLFPWLELPTDDHLLDPEDRLISQCHEDSLQGA